MSAPSPPLEDERQDPSACGPGAVGERRTALRRILAGRAPTYPVHRCPFGRSPPAARARLPVGPVALAAALCTATRGDVAPSPLPDVFPMRLASRVRSPVPILRGLLDLPAARAVLPVGAVPVPAATVAQPGRAIPITGAGRAGRQGAPARVHDDALVGSAGNAYPADPGGSADAGPRAAPGAPGARREHGTAVTHCRRSSRHPVHRPPRVTGFCPHCRHSPAGSKRRWRRRTRSNCRSRQLSQRRVVASRGSPHSAQTPAASRSATMRRWRSTSAAGSRMRNPPSVA